jgi:hypothetical protein
MGSTCQRCETACESAGRESLGFPQAAISACDSMGWHITRVRLIDDGLCEGLRASGSEHRVRFASAVSIGSTRIRERVMDVVAQRGHRPTPRVDARGCRARRGQPPAPALWLARAGMDPTPRPAPSTSRPQTRENVVSTSEVADLLGTPEAHGAPARAPRRPPRTACRPALAVAPRPHRRGRRGARGSRRLAADGVVIA